MFPFEKVFQYRASQSAWATGWPSDTAIFYSPSDGTGIHTLITDLINSAEHSVIINMYGYDDEDANKALIKKAADPRIYFQMSLDSSQAAGKTEKQILSEWGSGVVGNSIAIGQSGKHAISHLKVMIIDGLYVLSGSTNWSLGGEEKQDNELMVRMNAVVAAQYRSILDINHDTMLKQMAAKAATGAKP